MVGWLNSVVRLPFALDLLDVESGDASHAADVAICLTALAASSGVLATSQCCVYGYGRLADAPPPGTYPNLTILKPGQRLPLGQPWSTNQGPSTSAPGQADAAKDTCVCTDAKDGLREAQVASLERCLRLSDADNGVPPPDATKAVSIAPQEAAKLQLR